MLRCPIGVDRAEPDGIRLAAGGKRAYAQNWRGSGYHWKSGNGAFKLMSHCSGHAVRAMLLPITAPSAPVPNAVTAALLKQRTRPFHQTKQGAELYGLG